MTNEKLQKALLIFSGVGLIPIALSYGLIPEKTLTPLYGFSVESVNLTHIMRAITGLYIAQIIIWFLGAYKAKLRRPAMYCLLVFALGLAAGRVVSIILDGVPHWLLTFYLFLELFVGLAALRLIMNDEKEGNKIYKE